MIAPCVFVVALLGQASSADVPFELQEMISRRSQSFETAHIELKYEMISSGQVLYLTSRFAHGEHMQIRWGNQHGVLFPKQLGQPYSCSPVKTLRRRDREWFFRQGSPTVSVQGDDVKYSRVLYDFRTLGLQPTPTGISLPDRRAAEGNANLKVFGSRAWLYQFEVLRRASGLVDVVGHTASGATTWTLDPQMSYSPVSIVQTDADGQVLRRMMGTYRQWDRHWVPDVLEFYRKGVFDTRWTVLYASFDSPDHPDGFDPVEEFDLVEGGGIVYGTPTGKEYRVWGGERIITWDEFTDGLRDGSRSNAALVDRGERRHEAGPPGCWPDGEGGGVVTAARAASQPRLWEQFTHWFTVLHEFDRSQMQKSRSILRDAQVLGGSVFRAGAPERAKIEGLILDAIAQRGLLPQGGAKYAAADEGIRGLRKKFDALGAPLADIFEKRLKRRLEALRTRPQRDRANARRRELDAMIERAKRELDSSPAIEPLPAGP